MVATNFTRRPLFAAATIAGLVAPAFLIAPGAGRPVEMARSFYGPIAVVDVGDRRLLVQGNTIHGEELLDPRRKTELRGYYEPASGIGRLVTLMKDNHNGGPPMQGLVVGLGAGEMACMGDAKLNLAFAEIDATMIRVARKQFGFLAACENPSVELTDGRVASRHAAARSLDLLAMDAFSSDAVPAHLLTKEAFSGYASKLKAGGAIAVNVSNRYVGLAPVVAASAFANGMRSYDLLSRTSKGVSEWVVATADPALGDRLQREGWAPLPPSPAALWRDDRWSLVPTLRALHPQPSH